MTATREVLFIVVRYGVSALGTVLVTKEIVTQDQWNASTMEIATYLVGALLALAPVAWASRKRLFDLVRLNTSLAMPEKMSLDKLDQTIAAGTSAPPSVPPSEIPQTLYNPKG